MSGLPMAAGIENFAQTAVERVLNSLPEGLLLALSAWLLLRLVGRQNAGTRFAVWLMALAGVAGLPLLGGHAQNMASRAEVTVPESWAVALIALWLPIACVALARLIAGVWQVRRIRLNSVEVAVAKLDPALQAAIQQTGAHRRVRLIVSDHACVPAAIGFWNPAIVLPAWCLRELSADALRPILIHEMAHLQRRDDWTNLLQKFVRAVLFFHPAVWWIDARLSSEREMACDDAVLVATGNARAYAGSLIGLLERGCARRSWTMAQAAVARAQEASLRIARILDGGASATTRVGRGSLGLAAVLSVACCCILEVAPRMVAFEPSNEAAVQAQAPVNPDLAVRDVLSLHGAAVTPATFHPAAAQKPPITRKTATPRRAIPGVKNLAEQMDVVARDRTTAPSVAMAKLDESPSMRQSKTAGAESAPHVVMVVETAETEVVPVQPNPGAPEPTEAGLVTADGMRIMQVQTIQVVEETETGWQVRTYCVVLMVPAAQDGSKQSSI